MSQPTVAPYGAWRSPITADLIVEGTVSLGQIELDGDQVYWIEGRPAEAGRNVIVHLVDQQPADLTPAALNARTRVHEYGGGAFTVDAGTVFFSNFSDNLLYRQDPGQAPRPISADSNLRYADLLADRARNRLIAVREDHSGAGEAVNTLVAVDMDGQSPDLVLVSGSDFYASSSLSPDGTRLAWLSWNHPNMPWDGTALWVADIAADSGIDGAVLVAGGANESIFQPAWSPDGVLYFVSDRSGWWNLYRWRDGAIEPLAPMEAEFGLPQWVFRMSTYGFDGAGRLICVVNQHGSDRLAGIDTLTKELHWIETPYSQIDNIRVAPGYAFFEGGSPSQPSAVVQLDLNDGRVTELRRASSVQLDPGYLSVPQPIEFPTENGLSAYGIFYPPSNRDYRAPPGERPPLLVKSHGGPTAAASTALSLTIQFWTSRGFAVLDVNYGGSTGYGRAYRERLNGQWGVVDVDDCVNGARYLAEQELVDGERLAIDGGSAGGYTTLCVLTFRDEFKAGASYFGLSELEVFVHDTHKFESRYLDRLVGPYPAQRDLYRERSPINFTERLNCPMIFFQGLDDKIVPPNQSEMVVEALRARGLPVVYLAFEGEGHGFRRAETIKRALEAELYFFQRYLLWPDQPLPDGVVPVPLE